MPITTAQTFFVPDEKTNQGVGLNKMAQQVETNLP